MRSHRIIYLAAAALLVGVVVAAWPARWSEPDWSEPEYYGPSGELRDPIEDDPAMKPILDAADRDTQQALANDPPEKKNRRGYCHRVWGVKKRILREKYGVEWRTPPEMNPNIAFD